MLPAPDRCESGRGDPKFSSGASPLRPRLIWHAAGETWVQCCEVANACAAAARHSEVHCRCSCAMSAALPRGGLHVMSAWNLGSSFHSIRLEIRQTAPSSRCAHYVYLVRTQRAVQPQYSSSTRCARGGRRASGAKEYESPTPYSAAQSPNQIIARLASHWAI